MKKNGKSAVFQGKKIKKLLTKLIIFFIILVMVTIIFLVNLKIILAKKTNSTNRIDDLRIENQNVTREIEEADKKSKILENYLEVWNTTFPENQKKMDGIELENLQLNFEELAREYKIENLMINFSPVVLSGKSLDKDNVKVYTTLMNVRFSSVTDVNVFMFLDSLKDNLGYFLTIQDINLKRSERVDENLLANLRNGITVSVVEGDMKIRVYGLGKEKQ